MESSQIVGSDIHQPSSVSPALLFIEDFGDSPDDHIAHLGHVSRFQGLHRDQFVYALDAADNGGIHDFADSVSAGATGQLSWDRVYFMKMSWSVILSPGKTRSDWSFSFPRVSW